MGGWLGGWMVRCLLVGKWVNGLDGLVDGWVGVLVGEWVNW